MDRLLSRRHEDAELGTLVRGWGRWRGRIALGDGLVIPLVLAGWRSHPNEARLRLARDLVTRYEGLRPTIAAGLFEHYAPYAEAVAAGEEPTPPGLPLLARPDQVWPHVTAVRVLVEPLAGVETVEIAYRAAWDEEHTLGVRLQAWRLVEVNGSVLA